MKTQPRQHISNKYNTCTVVTSPVYIGSKGITAEYLNPSFLVKKTSGGFRLVTAFAEVGRYSKPQPSLMPDVDSTLRSIAWWKYLITSDLINAFYQTPLSKSSMKYCRVATSYHGVRVYTRWECLDLKQPLRNLCFMSSVIVFKTEYKLGDDLYCGGNTLDELLSNWKRVLDALQKSNLKLSPSKTVICHRYTWLYTILNNNNNNNSLYFQRVTHLAKYKLIFHEALYY